MDPDALDFLFTLKKSIDFVDEHCYCHDCERNELCKFCYFTSHAPPREEEVLRNSEWDGYDQLVKQFFVRMVEFKKSEGLKLNIKTKENKSEDKYKDEPKQDVSSESEDLAEEPSGPTEST